MLAVLPEIPISIFAPKSYIVSYGLIEDLRVSLYGHSSGTPRCQSLHL